MAKRIAVIGNMGRALIAAGALDMGIRRFSMAAVEARVAVAAFGRALPPREQQQAYESGTQDGSMGVPLSQVSARTIQERSGWADESVICYMNGVADGFTARHV